MVDPLDGPFITCSMRTVLTSRVIPPRLNHTDDIGAPLDFRLTRSIGLVECTLTRCFVGGHACLHIRLGIVQYAARLDNLGHI